MPKDTSSPFTPGIPVPVEFFVGRSDEIERLRSKLSTAVEGRLQVAFLSGERGIGKSSLASFVASLAEREQEMIGLHTFLGGVDDLEEMTRRIFDRLVKESLDKPWHQKAKEFFGNHVRKFGLFGVSFEFHADEEELTRVSSDFAPALRNLCSHLAQERKGIFLVLDDINGLASSERFANWIKSLVDEIATSRRPLPLFLLLVGLEERRKALIARQPSLARVFEVVNIATWSDDETREFYKKTCSSVNIRVNEPALQLLCGYTGGLPVLAHELGNAAFNLDEDGVVDRRDAFGAIVVAADIVGRKHLEPRVFQAIKSDRYRSILEKLTGPRTGLSFKRSDLQGQLSSKEIKVLDNFLSRMRTLGVIRKEAGRGAYRFTNPLYNLSISLLSMQAANKKRTRARGNN